MPEEERATARTIRAAAALGALEALSPAQQEAARKASGLSAEDLADPDRLLELEAVLRLTQAAAEAAGDDCLGLHLGASWHLGGLGVLSYAVLNAPTVGIGLRNLDRYGRSHLQGGRIRLDVGRGEAQLRYELDCEDAELARQHVESAAVVGLRIVRRLAGDDWRPRRVAFAHRRPRDSSEHALTFGCPVEFARPGASLRMDFPDDVLARSVPGADRQLLPLIERHLTELLTLHDEDGWLRQVRNAVAESLCDGSPNIRSIARQLGMSVRTLQRRLDERGVVFKALVAEIRQELAHRYLAEGEANLTEIAFLLGYSELSAFDRAFRRWTGSTPLAARRSLQASG